MTLSATLDVLVQLCDLTLVKVNISIYIFQALVAPYDKWTTASLWGYCTAQMSFTRETWSAALLDSGGVALLNII